MKRLILSIAILICATLQAHADDPFIGSWQGCVVSGGVKVPVLTHINKSESGYYGTYIFVEETGVIVPGTLAFKQHKKRDQLSLFWEDKYGSGEMEMRFSADRFIGSWKASESENWQGSWDGKRLKGVYKKQTECAPLIG